MKKYFYNELFQKNIFKESSLIFILYIKNNNGETTFFLSCQNNKDEIFQFLLVKN